MGYTSPLAHPVDPARISLSFVPSDGSEPLKLLTEGEPEVVDEARAKVILERDELEIRIELGLGEERAQYYTCDLSHVSNIPTNLPEEGTEELICSLVLGVCYDQRRLPELIERRYTRLFTA